METETSTEPAVTPSPGMPAAAPGTPNPWEGFEWDGNVDALPEPVAKVIRDARSEAGKARTTAKANAAQEAREALLKELAEKLNIGTAEEPPDPAKLTEHLQRAKADAAAAQVELRVFQLASGLGHDAKGLLDSRSFCDAVDALDVTDWADFDTKVTELIQQRAAAQPQRPSNGLTGHMPVEALRPGALPGVPEPTLADQIAAAERSGDVRESIRLKNLLAASNRK